MTSLASLSDLGVRLGLDLTGNTRAQALLDDASATVRDFCGQPFAVSANVTYTAVPCRGVITVPYGPVTAVASVKTAAGVTVTHTWASGRSITVDDTCAPLTATYSWGSATVPATVKAVVCQIAGRAYGTNAAEGGTTSETIGQHSITTGVIAAAGPVGLMPDEEARLEPYRIGSGPRSIDSTPWAQPPTCCDTWA